MKKIKELSENKPTIFEEKEILMVLKKLLNEADFIVPFESKVMLLDMKFLAHHFFSGENIANSFKNKFR